LSRRYGDNDPGEVTKISVKGESGVVYKLKVEKISGEGDAAFDAAGTQKEMDYTGTGSDTQIPLYGLKESTAEQNVKITGTKDGVLLDEQKFIVFSEIKIDPGVWGLPGVTPMTFCNKPICRHAVAYTGTDFLGKCQMQELPLLFPNIF